MNENAKTKLVLEYTGMDDFSCPVLLMENLPIPYSRSTHFIRLRIKEVPMNSSTGC